MSGNDDDLRKVLHIALHHNPAQAGFAVSYAAHNDPVSGTKAMEPLAIFLGTDRVGKTVERLAAWDNTLHTHILVTARKAYKK